MTYRLTYPEGHPLQVAGVSLLIEAYSEYEAWQKVGEAVQKEPRMSGYNPVLHKVTPAYQGAFFDEPQPVGGYNLDEVYSRIKYWMEGE